MGLKSLWNGANLIELFRTFSAFKFILFNDTSIAFVKPSDRRDDQFHVALIE